MFANHCTTSKCPDLFSVASMMHEPKSMHHAMSSELYSTVLVIPCHWRLNRTLFLFIYNSVSFSGIYFWRIACCVFVRRCLESWLKVKQWHELVKETKYIFLVNTLRNIHFKRIRLQPFVSFYQTLGMVFPKDPKTACFQFNISKSLDQIIGKCSNAFYFSKSDESKK